MNDTRNNLLHAQQTTIELFNTVEQRGLIVPGKTENELCSEIVAIAQNEFGVTQHWGKKIVRTGINTMQPYLANPDNLVIQEGDILFFDFHPVFDGWEADLGRTYILGNDALKIQMRTAIEAAWQEANNWYGAQTYLTGASFFNYIASLTRQYGYEFGNNIAGHIVGQYPHEQPADPGDMCLDVHPDNHTNILALDSNGNKRHWILELHFVDHANQFGAFFEQLLTAE